MTQRPYVYHLVDPRTGCPFYVGKGIEDRAKAHEQEARRGHRSAKHDRIREIWAAGLQVECRVVREFGSHADAYRFERAEIARLPALTNRRSGQCRGTEGSRKTDLVLTPSSIAHLNAHRASGAPGLDPRLSKLVDLLVEQMVRELGA